MEACPTPGQSPARQLVRDGKAEAADQRPLLVDAHGRVDVAGQATGMLPMSSILPGTASLLKKAEDAIRIEPLDADIQRQITRRHGVRNDETGATIVF